MAWRIEEGDVLDRLREMPAGGVQCVVTSPPYFGLRDYGTGEWVGGDPSCQHGRRTEHNGEHGAASQSGRASKADRHDRKECKCGAQKVDRQIGLEPTPEAFVQRIVEIMREVRRVLRDDGTVWLNLGDSYNSYAGNRSSHGRISGAHRGHVDRPSGFGLLDEGIKNKDMLGIPWSVALALRADGWFLRKDIIWSKPNPMPESVEDRPTTAHEYVFLLTKSPRYFYDNDAIRSPLAPKTLTTFGAKHRPQGNDDLGKVKSDNWGSTVGDRRPRLDAAGEMVGANARDVWNIPEELWTQFLLWLEAQPPEVTDVWEIASQKFPGAHFATFPTKLVEPCILAGTPRETCAECGAPYRRLTDSIYTNPGNRSTNGPRSMERRHIEHGTAGFSTRVEKHVYTTGYEPTCDHEQRGGVATVLDIFSGSGTTGLVAQQLGRDYIGIELNPEYAEMSRNRIRAWEANPNGDLGDVPEPIPGQMELA